MARTTGPLMSLDASGTFAKTIVFSKWKGRSYARELVTPANPKTTKQVGVRCMFAFLSAAWADLSTIAKSTYEEVASSYSISAFNAFIKENMTRWQSTLAPTESIPAAGTSTPITITTQTLTGGDNMVTLTITPSAGTNLWGFIIYRSDTAITTCTWAEAVAVVIADGANSISYVDSPLDAGTYHYRVQPFNTDGVLGTAHADGSATAT